MAEKTLNVADIDSKHCSSKQHTHTTINNQQQHTRNQQRKRKSISSSRATTAIIISFRWVPTRGSSNFFLENLRSKPGTHEFHAFNVQTHTGSNLVSPSPFYPLRVDSQGSERRLKLSSPEQTNPPPPPSSQLQPQPQHDPLTTPLHTTTTLPPLNHSASGSDIDMNSTTTPHHLQPNTSSRSKKSADCEQLTLFVCNDVEKGALFHKIDEKLALSHTHTNFAPMQPHTNPNLYAAPHEGAATNLIYAQTAIKSHSDKQICVTPQSAPQHEFANSVPSGTNY